ncbi:hypothetical protein BCR33DRAFT_723128 [Rhizoclosmatium globosum]|uniref:Retinoblastoma-associated protein B-box domain-containing protein n=1 Tax=Rhizoclosmatium globosum TaxID=329046 RepID=A0A1Y2BFD7_9FUNG|nr:hypothetical protein BCR33DRAFT_723128 [Rhizoclosmatium globosum]|eukprot:ORY33528.1 hypothetical protein BCR33DRAFT_723128 [Rhizoclosmatium globosum]
MEKTSKKRARSEDDMEDISPNNSMLDSCQPNKRHAPNPTTAPCQPPIPSESSAFTTVCKSNPLPAKCSCGPQTALDYINNEFVNFLSQLQLPENIVAEHKSNGALILQKFPTQELDALDFRSAATYLLWFLQYMSDPKTVEDARFRMRFESLCYISGQNSKDNIALIKLVYSQLVEFVQRSALIVEVSDSTLQEKLQQTVQSAKNVCEKRMILVGVYESMEKFIDVLVNPSEEGFKRAFTRYCWLLFILLYSLSGSDIQDITATACAIVYFGSFHIASYHRRTIKCMAAFCGSSGQFQDIDWVLDESGNVLHILSGYLLHLNPSFNLDETFFADNLFESLATSPFFKKSGETTKLAAFKFTCYGPVLSTGEKGDLDALLSKTDEHYETLHQDGKLEFDYRLLLPALRVFATPRKRHRPVEQSDLSAPAPPTRNLMKTVFVITSSCPQHANGAHEHAHLSQSEFRAKLEQAFSSTSTDQCDMKIKIDMSAASKAWDLIFPLYVQFLETFIPPKADVRRESVSLMIDANEFLNRVLQMNLDTWDMAIQINSIQFIELYMVVDLLQRNQLWFSIILVKRFVELRERILESYIWQSDRIYHIFNYAVSRQPMPDNHMTELFKLYTVLLDPTNKFQSITGSDSNTDPIKGIQSMLSSLTKLLTDRAIDLCNRIGNVSDIIQHRVTKLIESVLNKENQEKLLRKRNADVVMISCVFAGLRLAKIPIKLRQLVQYYDLQPQAEKETMLLIRLSDDNAELADISKFYNQVFMPAVSSLLHTGEEKAESIQSAVRAVGRGPVQRTPGMMRTLFSASALGRNVRTIPSGIH